MITCDGKNSISAYKKRHYIHSYTGSHMQLSVFVPSNSGMLISVVKFRDLNRGDWPRDAFMRTTIHIPGEKIPQTASTI